MGNPLLDLISRSEPGVTGDDADHREGADRPDHAIDLSALTLGQVSDRQHLHGNDPQRLFAVGRYRIDPATMDDAIASLQLDRHQHFTPALQDRIFSEYLIVDKRPQVHDYIAGVPGATLAGAQRGLAQEWPGFADPDGSGRSHRPPPGVAGIPLADSGAALEAMRAQYLECIAHGLAAPQAWQHVVDAGRPPPTDRSHGHEDSAPLRQGDHGDEVRSLQQSLAQLGYTDAHGRVLPTDGVFGPETLAAVQAFQRDHHLAIDGEVGLHTRETLAVSQNLPVSLADPRHPDHALYEQALTGVAKIDAGMGRIADQYSRNLAASLVPVAKATGMTRIDGVAITEDGSRTFAVQSQAGVRLYADVATAQAVHTPAEQSSIRALATTPPPHAEPVPMADLARTPGDPGHGM